MGRKSFWWNGLLGLITVAGLGVAVQMEQDGMTKRVVLQPQKVLHRVDEKVYGHFLEHIYHSVHGGLWGEMVWNRSFEEMPPMGLWRRVGNEVAQESIRPDVRLVFGDSNWSNYEFSLEAQKIGGQEGFLVLFRVRDRQGYYWLNLGGWGNTAHAIERGERGQRQRIATAQQSSRIEEGRWYRIRVRCEGRRMQAWLDDQLLIDFEDNSPSAHLNGRVGIGTWMTKARFRNLKVTALDGTVLWEGLPDVPSYATPRHWRGFGTGDITVTDENPLNSEYCLLLSCQEGEVGIRQFPLYFRAGERYQGSLWVRGEAPNGLVVRVREGEKVLVELKLPAPSEKWQEFPIAFIPNETATNGALEIAALAPARVWIDQVSLMAESSLKVGGFRPDLLEALKGLRPPVIRWPGGYFASIYHWKDGIGPQHQRRVARRPSWDDLDVNAFGTDEFIRLCRAVGAEPILVINIGVPYPPEEKEQFLQDAIDWVEYCNGPATSRWGSVRAANGHPEPYKVKFWEIDNETWIFGMSPEAYAEEIKRFVPAMKKVDPTIKIIACGSGGMGPGALRWNQVVIERCAELIDYISIHHYEDPNRFAEGPAAYEQFFRETAKFIANSRNPNIKIFVSEWNAQSTDWRTGLYAAGLLNAFERCGDFVEIGSPALLMRHWWSGVLPDGRREWDNAFINFDHYRWFPAPNYVVMQLWREHYAPNFIAMEGDWEPLDAVATKSEDGKTIYFKVVNPSREAASVELRLADGSTVQAASMKVINPGDLFDRNTLTEPNRIRAETVSVQHESNTVRFSLPPLSAGVVTIRVRD